MWFDFLMEVTLGGEILLMLPDMQISMRSAVVVVVL
jgi:hypothetical protein